MIQLRLPYVKIWSLYKAIIVNNKKFYQMISGFGNTSLMAPGHHSGNVNMNMSLPVSGSRDDSIQGT